MQPQTTAATVPDSAMTGPVHDALAGKDLPPGRSYLDSGYLSADLVIAGYARHGIALVGPLPAGTSARARAGSGYARADFAIDYDNQSDLPAGQDVSVLEPVCPARQGRDRRPVLPGRLRPLRCP